MCPHPRDRPDELSSAMPGDPDLEAFAERIIEDLIPSLQSSLEGFAAAALASGDEALGVEGVLAQVLVIIHRLRGLAAEIHAGPEAGSPPRTIEVLAGAVAAECENGQALLARTSELLAGARRLQVDHT
ncbi:hypothetical protein [Patulibacter minatonensis]|uniref:hypothetical protein n=1 Tax=Patulibacter minatonensis TaxID=298163 RepID=UPI000565F83E|nr:hypothetical protein [Patulibacter minatonensis]